MKRNVGILCLKVTLKLFTYFCPIKRTRFREHKMNRHEITPVQPPSEPWSPRNATPVQPPSEPWMIGTEKHEHIVAPW